jgi:amino acid permease
MLLLYTFLSFYEKASEVDLTKIAGLFMYTISSIYFFLPPILTSIDYLDLSNTRDFIRLASSIFIVLAGYPLIYLLGKLWFKQNISVEEYKERKKKEKEEEEKEKKEEKKE